QRKSQKYSILSFSEALDFSLNILACFSSFMAGSRFIPSFINFLSVISGKIWPSIFCLRKILKLSSLRFMSKSCKKIIRVSVSQFVTKEERFEKVVEVDM